MKKEDTVRSWMLLADGDLKTAKDELETENPITNTVCFHAQQCVEKYLKAYLTSIEQPFGKTHDIAELIELCKRYDAEFERLYELNAHRLTRYAVEVRYPDEFYIPSIEEAKNSIEIARKVKEFILEKIRKQGFNI